MRVYRNATVVDGTGGDRYVADVAIEGTRIVAIAQCTTELPSQAVEVDATGLVLAPGFIDMHAHSDLAVFGGAAHTAKLLQGVTTEVVGQDGIGYAPVDDAAAAAVVKQIAGWNGPLNVADMSWRSMQEYLATLSGRTAGNVAVLVPQGNLRLLAMGYDARPATAAELAVMIAHLEASLDAGAVGMSSGLTYAPGMFADTVELEALCRVVAERGGYWAPHTRGYGANALESFAEALDIGRRTGCPIHLTHATMNFAPNRGRAAEFLALVDAAIADGVDVTIDTYPYLPGATTLAALVPSWIASRNGGDIAQTMRCLSEADRERLGVELAQGCDGFHGEPADWAAVQLSGAVDEGVSALVGQSVAEIAADAGEDAVDTVVRLLGIDGGAIGVLMHVGDEDNVRAIMRHPVHSGGSDGILIGERPHPRGFGAFARYLGEYTRDLGILTLEEAVQHLAATPARRLGLHRGDAPRGIIAVGATADLVLFDAQHIAAGATFEAPRDAPIGVHEVLVNGTVVVRSGGLVTGDAGRVLRLAPAAHRATVPALSAQLTPDAPRVLAQLAIDSAVLEPDMLQAATQLLQRAATTADSVIVQTTLDTGLGAEGFRVEITPACVAVAGGAAVGVFRGLLALDQLRDPDDAARPVPCGVYTGVPAVSWRGMMLDVARHFRPVADVLRIIDLLARHGLNVLHLHLTDDQGWRYEVPGWPHLTAVGGTRAHTQLGHGPSATVEPGEHSGWYSIAELRMIDDYAAARGVTVVPEVELPGHVQAALAAYPQLGNCDAGPRPTEPWARFGLNPHTLNLEDETLAFCRAAIDVLCDAFRSDVIGIGGDEVPTGDWQASTRAMQRMAELGIPDVHSIQPWFTAQLAAYVRARGKRALAWDEVLAGPTPDGTIVAAWRGPVAEEVAMRRGFDTVLCTDTLVYLDYRQSESPDEPVPVGPPLTAEDTWRLTLPAGVRGGQANVWTEHLRTRDEVDFAIFPRLAVIAERLWSGGVPGEWSAFERTLETHLRRLASWGVQYRPLGGPFPHQRKPGVPGAPRTREERAATVSELIADFCH